MAETAPTTRVKIGLISVTREIDIEVDDADSLLANFEDALENGDPVWWITEADGRRHGLLVDKVAYVDIEPGRNKTVGFG